MKYLITESKLEKVIFRYLDNQDFIQIKRVSLTYFVNFKDDEYAQIRYDEVNGWCYISKKLVNEISSLFSLSESDSEQVVGRWVEDTLQQQVTHIYNIDTMRVELLRIPSNNRLHTSS